MATQSVKSTQILGSDLVLSEHRNLKLVYCLAFIKQSQREIRLCSHDYSNKTKYVIDRVRITRCPAKQRYG